MFEHSSSKDLLVTSYLFFNFRKWAKVILFDWFKCERILELHKLNLSQRVIASEIGRSKTVIANFQTDPKAYGTIKHTGQPKTIH